MTVPVISGARAIFALNGTDIGYARSVTVNEDIDWRPLETLNNIRVVEHVPAAYNCNMTVEEFRIVGTTLKSRNFWPKAGQNAAEHLANIINQGDLTATIVDSVTNQTLATMEGVRAASNNYTVGARDISGVNQTFVGRLLKDESELTNVVPSNNA